MNYYMDYIDKQRVADAELYVQQGSKPMKRVRGYNLMSRRAVPTGFPSCVYDKKWMKNLDQRYREFAFHVSRDDDLEWVELRPRNIS
jgi:hypothetical protein